MDAHVTQTTNSLNLDFIFLSPEDPCVPNTEQKGLVIVRYVKAFQKALITPVK